MKHYQDHDPLHGHGKAIPKLRRATQSTYRGARFGRSISADRSKVQARRNERPKGSTATNASRFTLAAIIAMVAGLKFRRR